MADSPGWRINFEPISLNLQVEKKKGTRWQLVFHFIKLHVRNTDRHGNVPLVIFLMLF